MTGTFVSGILVAIAVLSSLLAALAFFLTRAMRHKQPQAAAAQAFESLNEDTTTFLQAVNKNGRPNRSTRIQPTFLHKAIRATSDVADAPTRLLFAIKISMKMNKDPRVRWTRGKEEEMQRHENVSF